MALCVNHEVGNVALDLRCKGFQETFGGQVTMLALPLTACEEEGGPMAIYDITPRTGVTAGEVRVTLCFEDGSSAVRT